MGGSSCLGGKQQVMGEIIFFLVVAGAGFAVGRLTSRRRSVPGGDPSRAYGYGSTLPHPAQIFEEGYAAGRGDAAPGAEPSVTPHISVTPHASLTRQGTPASQAAPGPETRLPPLLLPPVPQAPQTSPVAPASAAPESYVPQPAAPESYAPRPAVPHSPNPPLAAPSPGPPQRMPAGPGAPGPGNPVLSEPVSRVPHAPVIPPQRPPLTEAELTEQKRRRDLRNINITLYSGSLLLVAAASLFIGISIPEQARFAGVAVLAALFYASGLVIHSRRKTLRPAAVAFTGTGLALIPVVGLAFYNLILPDPVLAWLATSLAGTAAFAYAAARLESRVVTYLALTFLLSTALASGAALRSGIVWYFISTVLLATLVSLAAVRRPGWLRNIYLDAFVASHRFLVPATAAAALLTSPDLGSGPLAVLFLVFAAYYGVMLWQGPANQALLHSYGLRVSAAAGLVILTFRATDSLPAWGSMSVRF